MLRLTRVQSREIDRRAIEEFHIPGVVLMENAARSAADVACQMLANDCGGDVLILCGGGNNGGDGLALARHLHNRGGDVTLALTVDPAGYQHEALVNWQIVSAMQLRITQATPAVVARTASLIVDAIFGTGLAEPPRDPFGALAGAINRGKTPVLALDVPSGLDCDTGLTLGPACIRATRTITFATEKVGFSNPDARAYLGEVIVGDIGCPRELIRAVAGVDPAPSAGLST